MMKKTNPVTRFWGKVLKSSNCWEWQGSLYRTGYARFSLGHRSEILAHRYSWLIENGEIPNGLWVLHHCDNRKCVNPKHLFLGTPKDNAEDREKKGRGARQDGQFNPMAKLSSGDVEAIRNIYIKGKITHKELGKKFGVNGTAIQRILAGTRW